VGISGKEVGIRKGRMSVNMVDYFVFIYENRRMKPGEIVLRRGKGDVKKQWRGVNLTMIYYKYICKYHNVSPFTTIIC
jgi:hypothetical protein